ncbi:MAG: hypothetical protein WBQ32_01010 [Ignavibacteriaceae bacterium]
MRNAYVNPNSFQGLRKLLGEMLKLVQHNRRINIVILTLFILSTTTYSQFQLPEYEKYTLPNGLTLYLMEQHEVPLVYVNAIFPGGAVWDGEQNGLAALTAEALLFGSRNYTKD